MRKITIAGAVASLIVTACGGATLTAAAPSPPESIVAKGAAAATLAEGQLAQLPVAPYYINILDLPQDGGGTLTHAHVGGFVYGAAGVTTIKQAAAPDINVHPGEAAFIGSGVPHTHLNAAAGGNDWWYVSLRPSSTRKAPAVVAGQKVLFETPDLAEMAPGAYGERLLLVTIEAGGRGAPHINGGSETLYVLSGTVRLRLSGRDVTLNAGEGFWLPADSAIQEVNAGTGQSRMLAFFVTPSGATFRTDTGKAP